MTPPTTKGGARRQANARGHDMGPFRQRGPSKIFRSECRRCKRAVVVHKRQCSGTALEEDCDGPREILS